MSEWLQTVILGIIEGITEFLPISSTGHLILAQYFLHDTRSEFFNVGIQSGAVLAVVLVYRERLWDLARNWKSPDRFTYIAKLAAAFACTAVLGLAVKHFGFRLPETPGPVAWAVLIGGLLIFAAEYMLRHRVPLETITWRIAVIVGVSQVLAGVFPGTSRSAATIIAAMMLGVSRGAATEFSFLLGIPTMFAAGAFSCLGEWKDQGTEALLGEMDQFLIGFVVSMIVGFVAVKWLLGFLRTHSFIPFAWYRLALGTGLLLWLAFAA